MASKILSNNYNITIKRVKDIADGSIKNIDRKHHYVMDELEARKRC